MTNFTPIFPLGIVVYPGEALNLHIFEPRYKQLINECFAQKKPFGIPVVLDKQMQEFGTLVEIESIAKQYEGGEMDIHTRGIKVFRLLELIRDIPDKLYSGAIVNYPDNDTTKDKAVMKRLMGKVRNLHRLLQIEKNFGKPDEDLDSYAIAHHVGLTVEQEFDLLKLFTEKQRKEFIRRHLHKAIPLLSGVEQLKQRIQLNGHFKNLSGFNL
ncbi:MAG: peptidase S16 [Chitinophagia bacterium]|jgi:Lon protease-like protein|nr:peptidase S16 [Chitinophagia bacterium]